MANFVRKVELMKFNMGNVVAVYTFVASGNVGTKGYCLLLIYCSSLITTHGRSSQRCLRIDIKGCFQASPF